MTKTVYLTGYQGIKPEVLAATMETLGADLFDIRFNPYSPNPLWQKAGFQKRLGDRYRHVKALGNSAYKTGGVELVDFDAGKQAIEENVRPVILMCACADAHTCHRSTVAEMLREHGYETIELRTQATPVPQQSGLW